MSLFMQLEKQLMVEEQLGKNTAHQSVTVTITGETNTSILTRAVSRRMYKIEAMALVILRYQ